MIKIVGAVPLLDFTLMHDADLIGDGEGFVLVMRHQQGGGVAALDDFAHLQRKALPQLGVQVRERFIE